MALSLLMILSVSLLTFRFGGRYFYFLRVRFVFKTLQLFPVYFGQVGFYQPSQHFAAEVFLSTKGFEAFFPVEFLSREVIDFGSIFCCLSGEFAAGMVVEYVGYG